MSSQVGILMIFRAGSISHLTKTHHLVPINQSNQQNLRKNSNKSKVIFLEQHKPSIQLLIPIPSPNSILQQKNCYPTCYFLIDRLVLNRIKYQINALLIQIFLLLQLLPFHTYPFTLQFKINKRKISHANHVPQQ